MDLNFSRNRNKQPDSQTKRDSLCRIAVLIIDFTIVSELTFNSAGDMKRRRYDPLVRVMLDDLEREITEWKWCLVQ
jgi:hypothetical protein